MFELNPRYRGHHPGTARNMSEDDVREAVTRARLRKLEQDLAAEATQQTRGLSLGLDRRRGIELRGERKDGKKILKGTAAKFNSLSEDLGGWVECLSPRCFDESLRRNPDLVMLADHNPASVLARVSAGTLDVNVDNYGLRFRAVLPDTTLGNDVWTNVESGLVRGCSFSMRVREDIWDEIDCDPDDPDCEQQSRGRMPRRTVLRCDVQEISSVVWPAYPETDITAASRHLPESMPAELRSRAVGAASAPLSKEALQELQIRARLHATELELL